MAVVGVDVGEPDDGETLEDTLGAALHPLVHLLVALRAGLARRDIDHAALGALDAHEPAVVPHLVEVLAPVRAHVPAEVVLYVPRLVGQQFVPVGGGCRLPLVSVNTHSLTSLDLW